jgi:V/A-type H+/Na+-transporting ATPase subunit I
VGVLRPEPMVKIGLLGLRDDEERVLTLLHDLRLAQIEPLSPGALAELAPARASELQRKIGDEALRFRGLLNALPRVGAPQPARFDTIPELLAAAAQIPIDEDVGERTREDDRLQTELKGIDDQLDLLGRMAFYPDRLELLRSANYLTFYGETGPEAFAAFRAALPRDADPQFLTAPAEDAVRFLVVLRTAGGDALSRAAQSNGVRLSAVPRLNGTVAEERARLTTRRGEVVARRDEIARELAGIASQWYPRVAAIDEALTIQNRKFEITTRLGVGRAVFALEAWVPTRDVERLKRVIGQAVQGRIEFYPVPTTEEPPTLMNNPRGIRRFEFFIRFYSLPEASEWDPTLVFAIVFPLFFALMLGDWGYGLTILLICIWMIRGFPGAQRLPKFGRTFVKRIMGPQGMQQLAYALLPGCLLAIGLGLYWDEFFGYSLFHTLFGYNGPANLRTNPGFVGLLLLFAGFVGLGMVTLGFLMGLLKEYFRHHRRGALGKLGGILFAWGIAFFGLSVIHPLTLGRLTSAGVSFASPLFDLYFGLLIGGLLLLLLAEGIMTGAMSIIEVVSHILSYTRLVGILLASIILALVINDIGGGLIVGGTIVGIVFGAVIILMGQSFNVILGVFEPGIQGARLIFVEYFSKFYTGNGKAFHPFGAPRTYTVSSIGPDGLASGPIIRAPPPP